jgi:hypothetical protein
MRTMCRVRLQTPRSVTDHYNKLPAPNEVLSDLKRRRRYGEGGARVASCRNGGIDRAKGSGSGNRVVMDEKEQPRAMAGRPPRRGAAVTSEQRFLGWAALIIGGLFMATGGIVMILSLS